MKNTNKLLVVLLALTVALSGIVTTLTTSARELDTMEYAFYAGSECSVPGNDDEAFRDYENWTYNLDYYEKDLYAPFDNEYAELEEGGVYKAVYWLTINYINNFNDTQGWEVKFMPTEEYYMNITNADIWNQEGPTSVAVVVPFKVTDINNVKLKMWSHGALIDGSCLEGISIVGADYNIYEYGVEFDIVIERVANVGSNVENNKPADDEWTVSDPDAVGGDIGGDIIGEVQEGMNATHYRPELAPGNYIDGEDVLVQDFYGAYCGYDKVKQFDTSIDGLLGKSFVRETVDVTAVNAGNQDNYIMKWTGTMTATETGTYTLIGRKIDNGFVMFVENEKVYEYWGASHWFDGAGDRLVSDEGSFDVVAGESYNVEIYFLELGGGDALEIFATTNPDDTNSGANMNDVFDFDLTRETYWLADQGHWNDYANDVLVGAPTGEGNGGQCGEDTALFYESIDSLLNAFVWVEDEVVSSFSEPVEAYEGDAPYVIEYSGVMVPEVSGEYTFGADVIDNGFYLEYISLDDLLAALENMESIEDLANLEVTTAYEFWVGRRWNDDGSGNTYGQSVTLEAGKQYIFAAAFLETNGGQALEMVASVDGGERTSVDELFTFYTAPELPEEPTDEPISLYFPMPGFTTSELAAGAEEAYLAYGFNGYDLIIEDADAYVIHNGITYTAVDGVVTVTLSSEYPMMPAEFVIGNGGSEAEAYAATLYYEAPLGTMDNPEVIEESGDKTASIEAGSMGYFYTWTAPADGTVSITVNGDGWTYAVDNMTTGEYGDIHWFDDDPVVSTETLTVTAGTELQIMVNTYDPNDEWNAPEGEVSLTLTFPVEEDDGTGDGEGTGDEGTGDEGAGDEGTGDEGSGDEGTGDEGAGDEGAGDVPTDKPTDKPVTGDVAAMVAILAAGVASFGGMKLRKKSK